MMKLHIFYLYHIFQMKNIMEKRPVQKMLFMCITINYEKTTMISQINDLAKLSFVSNDYYYSLQK